jgi:hypothetical protein
VGSFYEPLEEDEAGGRYRATVHTNGPWGPGTQHAGPPCALLTRAVRRLPGGPPDALPARLAFDILAPVPVADVVVRAQVRRPGRRVSLVEATLSAAGEATPCVVLSAWLLRRAPVPVSVPTTPTQAPPPPVADDAPVRPRPAGWHPGYLDAVAWHWVAGSFEQPGPATVWSRLRVDLVAGERPTGLERLVAVADSASGISAVANPAALLFVNTDLTLHLHREPQGERIWMTATTVLDPAGTGTTASTLGDEGGAVGHGAQTLFVEARDASTPPA